MKKTSAKLRINKQTIRHLSTSTLAAVAGGDASLGTQCCPPPPPPPNTLDSACTGTGGGSGHTHTV